MSPKGMIYRCVNKTISANNTTVTLHGLNSKGEQCVSLSMRCSENGGIQEADKFHPGKCYQLDGTEVPDPFTSEQS